MTSEKFLPVGSKIVLATHNKGKFQEFMTMMKPLPYEVVSIDHYPYTPPPETGATFAENAAIKARAALDVTHLPSLADDSGLCVDALNGKPGIYSARWAGPDRNFRKAMEDIIKKIEGKELGGYFACTLALICPGHKQAQIFEGTTHGHLCWPPRGGNGHGYDSFFVPTGSDLTFAQMSEAQKNTRSPRAKALRKLFEFLK